MPPVVSPVTGEDDGRTYETLQIIAHEKTHRKAIELFSGFHSRGPLLEIPAGEGALAWQLHKLGYAVTAGDIDPRFFKVAPIPCIYVDLNRPFPIEDARFEFISCIEGIEHLQDQFQFVRECHRVLKPGGTLVLSTPNILNLASRLKYLLCGFYSLVPRPINEFSRVPVFDHINPITYYQLRYALHTQGFRITRVTTDFHRRSAKALYFLLPMVRLCSRRTMRKETDPSQRAANRAIRSVLASRTVLLGRTLIVVARKKEEHAIRTIQASEV
ncbi:MAG: methyltransferase domain-containing protein [Acidobacteria bacterium]|nr:methyltransferase domain-containing protein [Acidobacteriota bacterium]